MRLTISMEITDTSLQNLVLFGSHSASGRESGSRDVTISLFDLYSHRVT